MRGEEGELLYIPGGWGWDFLPPRTGSWGLDPQEAHPEDSGVSGHLSTPPAAIPLLPFPQGLGNHHSGLRTIKDWEPGGWASPQVHPPPGTFRTGGTKDPWVTWRPIAAPLMLGGADSQARSLPSIPGAPLQRLQGPGSDQEAHRAPGPLSLHPRSPREAEPSWG